MKQILNYLWFLIVLVAVFKIALGSFFLASDQPSNFEIAFFAGSRIFLWGLLGYAFAYLFLQIYEKYFNISLYAKRSLKICVTLCYILLQITSTVLNLICYNLFLEKYPVTAVFLSTAFTGLLIYLYIYIVFKLLGVYPKLLPRATVKSFIMWFLLLSFSLFAGRSTGINNDFLRLVFAVLSAVGDIVLFSMLAIMFCKGSPNQRRTSFKRLLIVNPMASGIALAFVSWVKNNYAPLFSVLRSRTPEDWTIDIHNTRLWYPWHVPDSGLVAISCCTSNSYRAYKIAKQCQDKGLKVVMGGPHVSHNRDEALAFCDAVVIGEAESVWATVCEDYLTNRLKQVYEGTPEEDFIGRTHEELLKIDRAKSRDFLETTRGCKFGCEFCSVPVLSFQKLRYQKIQNIVNQLKYIKKKFKTVNFIDNNVFSSKTYAQDLFQALKPLKISWAAGTSIDLGGDDQSLKQARESGLKYVLVGYEVATNSMQRDLSKKFRYIDKYIEYSRKIKSYGIKIKAGFIYGFDGDNWRYLLRVFDLFRRVRPNTGSVTILTPLPGTALYKRYLKEDRMAVLNWKRFDLRHMVFVVLEQSVFSLMSQFYLARYGTFFLFSCVGPILLLGLIGSLVLLAGVVS